jgi:hypothetical protein
MKLLPILSYSCVIAGAMVVASCDQTSWSDPIRETVKERGADAADASLENMEYTFCHAPTIGSIKRNYFGTPKCVGYGILCGWPQGITANCVDQPRNLIPGS